MCSPGVKLTLCEAQTIQFVKITARTTPKNNIESRRRINIIVGELYSSRATCMLLITAKRKRGTSKNSMGNQKVQAQDWIFEGAQPVYPCGRGNATNTREENELISVSQGKPRELTFQLGTYNTSNHCLTNDRYAQ